MTIPIPKFTAPKMIKGQTGPYWETAVGPECGFYMKFKFEPGTAVVNGNQVPVDVLQGNILYFGPQFEPPKPYGHLDSRPYVVEDKAIQGHVVGKLWVPMGEFQKAFKTMHEFVREKVCPVLDATLEPLYAAAGATALMPQADLWTLLMDGLEKDTLRLDPIVFVNEEYQEDKKAQVKLMQKKYETDPSTDDLGDSA